MLFILKLENIAYELHPYSKAELENDDLQNCSLNTKEFEKEK